MIVVLVPTRAPVVTSAFNTSGKSIQIEWVNIPLPYQNGFLLGYTVHFHRTDQNSSASKIVNCSTSHENVTKFEIRELDLHTNYTFAIGGFTGKGVGMLCKKFIAQTGPFCKSNSKYRSHMSHSYLYCCTLCLYWYSFGINQFKAS